MPNMHAKSVVEEVGRANVTWGHYHHGLQNWLLGIAPMKALIKREDSRRLQTFIAKRKEQEATKAAAAPVSEEKPEQKQEIAAAEPEVAAEEKPAE